MARRRHKKKHQDNHAPKEAAPETGVIVAEKAIRPTAERFARGQWHRASRSGPVVDLCHDMIAALHTDGDISYAQEQNARLFQEVRAAWLGELALSGYRSCLDIGATGYDATDGNPAAIKSHDAMKRRLGVVRYLYIATEVEKGSHQVPASLETLRRALDAIGG